MLIRCIESHFDHERDDFIDTTEIIPFDEKRDELENVFSHLLRLTNKYGKIIGLTGTPGQPYSAVNLEYPGKGYSVHVRFERAESIAIESLVANDVKRYYHDTGE